MAYFLVKDYMGSKSNEVWVDQDSAEEYIQKNGSKQKIEEYDVVDGQVLVCTQQ